MRGGVYGCCVGCVVVDEEDEVELLLFLFLFRFTRSFFCSSALTQLMASNSFSTSSASSLLEKDNDIESSSNNLGKLVHGCRRSWAVLRFFLSLLGSRYLNDQNTLESFFFPLLNEWASVLS